MTANLWTKNFTIITVVTLISVMMVAHMLTGILAVTSFNIRISATQNYVPDEKRGRFHGLFMMVTTAGGLIGQLIAGGFGGTGANPLYHCHLPDDLFCGSNLLYAPKKAGCTKDLQSGYLARTNPRSPLDLFLISLLFCNLSM